MPLTIPSILALDFDGVLLDGLVEYFFTTQRAYCRIWQKEHPNDLNAFSERFYRLRPVIETGWEMPILLRALINGWSEAQILQDWQMIAQEILIDEGLERKKLADELDRVRDSWINSDVEEWLGFHRFYSGTIERVKQILASSTQLYIVTTKEGRFVRQLLSQAGVRIRDQQIIGKECRRPKFETLRQLLKINGQSAKYLWFVEDRLKTLQSVLQHDDLAGVGLFLADWGYNTQQARALVMDHPNFRLLSLAQFTQDFSVW